MRETTDPPSDRGNEARGSGFTREYTSPLEIPATVHRDRENSQKSAKTPPVF
jgi:hypothetical protein